MTRKLNVNCIKSTNRPFFSPIITQNCGSVLMMEWILSIQIIYELREYYTSGTVNFIQSNRNLKMVLHYRMRLAHHRLG